MKAKLPDQYVAAHKVVEAIDSCVTMAQLSAAKRFADAYHIMFEPKKWGFMYDEDIMEAFQDKKEELELC